MIVGNRESAQVMFGESHDAACRAEQGSDSKHDRQRQIQNRGQEAPKRADDQRADGSENSNVEADAAQIGNHVKASRFFGPWHHAKGERVGDSMLWIAFEWRFIGGQGAAFGLSVAAVNSVDAR